MLALTLLYEIHDLRRFDDIGQFLSYARLVRPAKESAGKRTGMSNRKMGNAHPKWAFGEAVGLMLRGCPEAKAFVAKKERTHGEAKALAIQASKLGRAVYVMLRRGEPFNAEVFMRHSVGKATSQPV